MTESYDIYCGNFSHFDFAWSFYLDIQRTVERWLRKERDEERKRRKERKAKGLPEYEKQVEGTRVVGGDPGRAAGRPLNNGWAGGTLHSTIAGEENFFLSSNRVLR
uniref:ABC transporter family protein n=1 Tax=Solanum tuberosum TaxID=4113 RepID=M0ZSN4_SOLTU